MLGVVYRNQSREKLVNYLRYHKDVGICLKSLLFICNIFKLIS